MSVAGYTGLLTQGHAVGLLTKERDLQRTVAAMLALALARVEAESRAGAALLKLISFMAPDAIPLEVISGGAEHLPESLRAALTSLVHRNKAVAALLRYSLIRRDGDDLSAHHLVQAVTRQRLADDEHKAWAAAAVTLMNDAVPDFPYDAFDAGVAAIHDRLGAHALAAAAHAAATNVAPEAAARLLNQIGVYRHMRADFVGAKAAFERALAIDEKAFAPDHPHVAVAINNLGMVLQDEGDLAGAKAAFERALAIDERAFGPEHPNVAIRVDNLGAVLRQEGNLAGAKAAFERALSLAEKAFGPDHPIAAIRVNNLGLVLREEGDLAGAKAAFERALAIDEQAFGPEHPNVARGFNNLGLVLRLEGDLGGAEAAFERALAIDEKAFGPEHPNVATGVNNLGGVLEDQGDLVGAKAAYGRALAIWDKCFGPEHPLTKKARANLARVSGGHDRGG